MGHITFKQFIGIILIVLVVLAVATLTGCQSKATSERFVAAQSNVLTCQERVLAYKEKLAQTQVSFKDEQNALLYLVVQELAKSKSSDDLQACDDVYVAMIQADARKTGKLIDGGFRIGGFALGLIGVDMIVDGITELGNQGTSSTTNYTNSRVVSNSPASGGSTISSSGTGLGIGNSYSRGSGQQVSGIQPRTSPVNQSENIDNRPQSNSGANEDFDGDTGQDIIDSDTPEVLPEL